MKLFYLLFILLVSCASYPKIDLQKADTGAIQVEGKKQSGKVLYFPSEEKSSLPPVILSDPILLDLLVLNKLENHGLIPHLNSKGFDVYLITPKEPLNLSVPDSLDFISASLETIKAKSGKDSYYLGALSIGGQSFLQFILQEKEVPNFKLLKFFSIGTGVDYNYDNSFFSYLKTNKYENKEVQKLCEEKKTDSFCDRFVSFNNSKEGMDHSRRKKYLKYIPKLNYDLHKNIQVIKSPLPVFMVYGKVDGISPEESYFPYYFHIKKNFPNTKNILFEVSSANGGSIDYDHLDLFLYKKAEKEIYCKISDWLKE